MAFEGRYAQEFILNEVSDVSRQISVEIKTHGLNRTRVFQTPADFRTQWPVTSETVEAPVVFAGYGITEKEAGYDDFQNLDAGGKIVLILSEAPGRNDPRSPFLKPGLKEKYFAAAGLQRPDGGGFSKTREVLRHGAVAVLQVDRSLQDAAFHRPLLRSGRISDDKPIWNNPRWKYLLLPGGEPELPWEASSRAVDVSRETADAILEGSGQKIERLRDASRKLGSRRPWNCPGPG